ncbi:MAG: hypothetical protein ACP5P1_11290 [Acidimicrobiales bacterium]
MDAYDTDEQTPADVHFGPNTLAKRLHAAYRTWLCLPPFPAGRPSN